MAGSACFPSVPSFVLFSVLLLVLTMLTEKFFFVIFGPIDVVLRSDELFFVFDSVDLFQPPVPCPVSLFLFTFIPIYSITIYKILL